MDTWVYGWKLESPAVHPWHYCTGKYCHKRKYAVFWPYFSTVGERGGACQWFRNVEGRLHAPQVSMMMPIAETCSACDIISDHVQNTDWILPQNGNRVQHHPLHKHWLQFCYGACFFLLPLFWNNFYINMECRPRIDYLLHYRIVLSFH